MTVKNEFSCCVGINPLGPSRKVKAAVRKAVKDIGDFHDSNFDFFLKLLYSKFGFSQKELLFSNSLDSLIYDITRVLKPRKVLIIGPALPVYEDAALRSGAEVNYLLPGKTDEFNLRSIGNVNNLDQTDLIFMANPNRITGRHIKSEGLNEILSELTSRNIKVLLDQALCEFTEEEITDDNIRPLNGIFKLRTTACFYGLPGLELAYAFSDQNSLIKLKNEIRSDLNILSVEAARAAYKDKAYIRLSKQYFAFEKNLLLKAIKKVNGLKAYGTDTNMILLEFEAKADEVKFIMKKKGFPFLDGGLIKGLGPNFLSIPIMKHEDNLGFIKILSERFASK